MSTKQDQNEGAVAMPITKPTSNDNEGQFVPLKVLTISNVRKSLLKTMSINLSFSEWWSSSYWTRLCSQCDSSIEAFVEQVISWLGRDQSK